MHVKLWSLNAFWQMWNWEGKVKDELKPKRLAYSYPDAWPQRHWRTAINILFEVIKLHGFSYLARLEGGLSRSIINNLHVKLGLPPLHFGKCGGGSKMNQSPCGEFPLDQSKQLVDACPVSTVAFRKCYQYSFWNYQIGWVWSCAFVESNWSSGF